MNPFCVAQKAAVNGLPPALYKGVRNPVQLRVPGYDFDYLHLAAAEGRVDIYKDSGRFIIRADDTGYITFNLFFNQELINIFKLRVIPARKISVGLFSDTLLGNPLSTAEFNKTLRLKTYFQADSPLIRFVPADSLSIIAFEITVIPQTGSSNSYRIFGDSIPAGVIPDIIKAASGDRFLIHSISCEANFILAGRVESLAFHLQVPKPKEIPLRKKEK